MTARSDAMDIGYALDAAVRDRDKWQDIAEALADVVAEADRSLMLVLGPRVYQGSAHHRRIGVALDRWQDVSGQEWRDW